MLVLFFFFQKLIYIFLLLHWHKIKGISVQYKLYMLYFFNFQQREMALVPFYFHDLSWRCVVWRLDAWSPCYGSNLMPVRGNIGYMVLSIYKQIFPAHLIFNDSKFRNLYLGYFLFRNLSLVFYIQFSSCYIYFGKLFFFHSLILRNKKI